MKIHRVVQMLGAITSTGKLADDMYDLNYKDYYSEAEDRYIPISHMDFQHMVRAFVKQNEETDNDFSRSMKLRNHLQEENEKLEMENQRLVQRKANDIVSKEAYQVMWDNCEKLKEDVKKTDDIVEHNDRIYKKNLAELQERYNNCRRHREDADKQVKYWKELAQDNFIQSIDDSETSNVWKERYEHELSMAEHWKDAYYKKDVIKGCGYVFSEIPNDTDGQEFVDNMKKYFNKKSYKMRVRGQHVKPELRGTGVTSHGQNIDESTHLRVYIDVK